MTRPRLTPGWVELRAIEVFTLPFIAQLPQVRLADLFPGIENLEISIRHGAAERALGYGEALVLSLIAAYLQPDRVFEIGTATGQGAVLVARQAEHARIDTLDLGHYVASLGEEKREPPWRDAATLGKAFRESRFADRIEQHLGDSARFDFASFRNQMDLVIVDGAHTRPYVRADSESALSLIKPDGVIVWDDCSYLTPGVPRALAELRRKRRDVRRIAGTRLAVLSGR